MTSPSAISNGRLAALLIAFLWSAPVPRIAAQAPQSDQKVQRVPVLVELFTSEGCSDCPPADALLAELDAKQFVPGAQSIVLSEHVTYWNHLGWRDPFSLDAMTERQQEYVRRFSLDSSYTPQMVVDGTSQFVGSDGRALLSAVSKAAIKPKTNIAIEGARWDHGTVRFAVHAEKMKDARLIAVLAADATHSEVARGENAGRTLHHTAVVRVMKVFSSDALDGRPLELQGGPLAQANEANGPVRLVVFLADSGSGRVSGAAQQVLPR
jgi:hypothetical protein